MSTTAITFVVDANVGPAQAKLDATQRAFEDAAGGADKLSRALNGLKMANAAADASRFNVAMGSASKGTRNLGGAALDASRAIEDLQYGFAGIVNNIPSLVMGLGMTAGVAGAVSLVAIGANQAIKYFNAMPDATSAAADAAKTHMDAIAESVADANEELNKLLVGATRGRIAAQEMAVAEAKQATERTRAAFRDQFGINPMDQRAMGRIASLAQGGRDVTLERWNAQKGALENVRVAALDVMEAYRETTAAYAIAVDEQVLLSKYRQIEDERIAQARIDAEVDAANAVTKAEEDADKKRLTQTKKATADHLREIEYRANTERDLRGLFSTGGLRGRIAAAERERMLAGMTDDDILTVSGPQAMRVAQEQETANLIRGINDELRASEQASWDSFYSGFGNLAQQGFGMSVRAAGDYFDAVITGQDNAEAMLAVSLMRSAGDALVGSGIKLGGEAVVSAFTPGLQGLAAAQAAASAGLITAGLGMGAGATAIQHASAGGTIGQALPERDSRSANDRGAAPGRSSGGGGGGALVLNVSFGAGGPHPEDIAREIHKVIRTDDRRRGAA